MQTATTLTINYNTSVFTSAGWRGVSIRATAEKVSAGMAVVTSVIEIDGETPAFGMRRKGGRHQAFNGKFIALREVGAKKRLSACEIEA